MNEKIKKLLSITLACAMMLMIGLASGVETESIAYAEDTAISKDQAPYFVGEGNLDLFSNYATATTVTIKLIQDVSYQNTFAGTNEMWTSMDYASKSFRNRWDINFDYDVYNAIDNTLYVHECELADSVECNTRSCGSSCYAWTVKHHKNLLGIHNEVKGKGWLDAYDLLMFSTTVSQCYEDSGEHTNWAAVGLANRNGVNTTIAANYGINNNIRIMQHELSHNFGCYDKSKEECLDENGNREKCIMSGGFDNDPEFFYSSIWCYQCELDFDQNKF